MDRRRAHRRRWRGFAGAGHEQRDQLGGRFRQESVRHRRDAGGVLLVAPEVVGWAVLPIHRWLDSLILPSESEPPPADYTLARFYATRMRYEEACEEYSKIIRYHPEESVAYLEGIRAASHAGDRKLAASFHRKGRRALRSPDERRLLDNVYGAQHKPVGLSHGETGADGNSEVAVGSE